MSVHSTYHNHKNHPTHCQVYFVRDNVHCPTVPLTTSITILHTAMHITIPLTYYRWQCTRHHNPLVWSSPATCTQSCIPLPLALIIQCSLFQDCLNKVGQKRHSMSNSCSVFPLGVPLLHLIVRHHAKDSSHRTRTALTAFKVILKLFL